MNTLGDVIAETQGLLGDPDGGWVTRGYILPFINFAYRLEYLAIKASANGRNLEAVVEVLNLPIGTTTLYPLQAKGKPLEGLRDPLNLWWKLAGQSPSCYAPANPRETLPMSAAPGILANTFSPGLAWTWMGSKLLVTPMAAAIDILVDARFSPPALVNDADILVLHPDIEPVTAGHAAATAGVERTNPAVLAGYAAAADAGQDNIIADLICQKQRFPKRLGKQAPGCGWGWG